MQRSDSTSSITSVTEDEKKIYTISKSRFIGFINWVHVFWTYLPFIFYLVVFILLAQIAHSLHFHEWEWGKFLNNEVNVVEVTKPQVMQVGWQLSLMVLLVIAYINNTQRPVYLLDFACFEPPKEWKLTHEQTIQCMRNQKCYTEDSLKFMEKIIARSGVGPLTAWPPAIIGCLDPNVKVDNTPQASREEARTIMFDVVRKVLKSTGVKPSEIDILVINCSLFSPTPSLCAMVVNEFKLRQDCLTYNLSGMGCSAGVISIDLVKRLFKGRPRSLALVVSTELISQCLYYGNDRSFLVQNTLFRCGGAAILLSNKIKDGYRANFKLLTSVRTQLVSEDSMEAVFQKEDDEAQVGVQLSKEIPKVAGRALEKNFTALGTRVLPLSEQAKVVFWMGARWLSKTFKFNKKIDPYIPDFTRGLDHFCVHAGGRAVIDSVEKNLKLTKAHVEASRYALYHYGNTSSSSIWYEMDYIRSHSSLKVGQRVLQIAFGSGFKCNSAVWLCINNNIAKQKEPKEFVFVENLHDKEKKDK